MVTSEAASSSHDQERTETIPEPWARPRYIYYRVYSRNRALESNNPIYSNDRFISRTLTKSVAPPHTAASLKKHLRQLEGLDLSAGCTLYRSLSDQVPVDDSVRLALRGIPGPGASELDPVALVVEASDAKNRNKVDPGDERDPIELSATRGYVHYRVYNDGGDTPSKTSFDVTDFSLGRIDALSVPPPHTALSLKSRLTQAEGISPDRNCKLFEDQGGEIAMNDDDTISLFADGYPGVSCDEPIAIVYSPEKVITSATIPPGFTKKLTANLLSNWADYDARWHTVTPGAIFHTDGVVKRKPFMTDKNLCSCYVAIDSAGKKAFVYQRHTSFC